MYDFKNAAELLDLCSQNKLKISDIMKKRECELGEVSMEQICSRMMKILTVMRESATAPIETPVKSMGGLIGGEAKKLNIHQNSGKSICGNVLWYGITYAIDRKSVV